MSVEQSAGSIEKQPDLRGLRALIAVSDSGSFRAAAAELGYTQSAVSHQIAELERAVGAALFTRPGGRGQVSLTPAGEAAYVHARRVLAELDALDASVQATQRGERTLLRVGVFQTAAAELLPTALRALREEWPGVEVALIDTAEDPRLVDWVAQGRLDLALTMNQEPDDRIEVVRLFEDPWVILTHRDSEMAAAERPSFDLLDGADVVAWTSRWPIQGELEAAWRKRGITPKVVYRTDDNLALQRLVAAGLGHACIGRLAARRAVDPALTWLAPPDILTPRVVALCHPRRRHLAQAARALSAALRDQFAR
ncbi:MAG TPA: LysR family transcriptional regulator [Solirubrobacteraceae bacterium]|nr:LysR family transcriptional regulator [Solirubrobacteraceae bacterium]